MEQLGFEGGGNRASAGVETMDCVLELNLRHQVEIQYTRHRLP